MPEPLYNQQFYENQQQGSVESAQVVVPMIQNLIQPQSVVDVGCGVGSWLSVFDACGVEDYLGIDGDYVDQTMLLIPPSKFQAGDLIQPIHLTRTFDLAVSLEVAEHLPHDQAEQFVKTLTSLAPVILFSAAIPFQGGTGHVNEQWPEYWQTYFNRCGYILFDVFRANLWNNEAVQPWYRQNIFLYLREDRIEKYPRVKEAVEGQKSLPLSVVHPETYLYNINLVK
ncbi:class I SAM-dependent methyltransferase [Phormidium pseudopriestleyi FRX01]|uniref:Class I SAM-dependent methyltransferase n=1 Tax=Phormidium pseudopriestleyi FRX01 TaxID=1759528 RepID=A0ABS3FS00_9CYAN|nr:class I SAM-dependent methyltransferase [Phormidium pseudopriestleyi]MBO0349881.1 class I SAM-dependent methyltransferase [Phormidium pseudopriestleyi FRX01]